MSNSNVKKLQTIFPDADQSLIRDVLQQCHNNVDAAAERLIMLTNGVSNVPTSGTSLSHPVASASKPSPWPLTPSDMSHKTPVLRPINNQLRPYHSTFQPRSYHSHANHPRLPSYQSNMRPHPPNYYNFGVHPGSHFGVHNPAAKPVPQTGQSGFDFHSSRAERKLIILRGLPGSGKTTLAKQLVKDTGVICSTDDFFVENGRYLFDPTKLTENHQKNQDKVQQAMREHKSPIIIDNTNSVAWEMKPYVSMALSLRYDIEFIEPDTTWKFDIDKLERFNSHGVGHESLQRMLERYEHDMTVEKVLASEKPVQRSQQQDWRRQSYTGSYYRHPGSHGNRQYGNRYPNESNRRYLPGGFQTRSRGWSDSQTSIGLQSHTERQSHTGSSDESKGLETNSTSEYMDQLDFSPPKVLDPYKFPTEVPCKISPVKSDETKINNTGSGSGWSQLKEEDSSIVSAKIESDIHKFDRVTGSNLTVQVKGMNEDISPMEVDNSTSLNDNTKKEVAEKEENSEWPCLEPVIIRTSPAMSHNTTVSLESSTSNIVKTETHSSSHGAQGHLKAGTLTQSNSDTAASSNEGGRPEDVPIVVEHENDLVFLKGCFPNFSQAVLHLLYDKANKDIMTAVDLALHIPISDHEEETPSAAKSDKEDMDVDNDVDECRSSSSNEPSLLNSSFDEHTHGSPNSWPLLKATADVEEVGIVGEVNAQELINDDVVWELGFTDEQYARILQDQLRIDTTYEDEQESGHSPRMKPSKENSGIRLSEQNRETKTSEPNRSGMRLSESTTKIDTEQSHQGYDEEDDSSNLVLRLTPSLAKQLQAIYGSVTPHLPSSRKDIEEEDLLVLLSENAAREIYRKWIDTLQAKKIEYEILGQKRSTSWSQPRRHHSGPSLSPEIGREKKKKKERVRVASSPTLTHRKLDSSWSLVGGAKQTPFSQIMDEQFADQLGQNEVEQLMGQVIKERPDIKSKLNNLYSLFPRLSHSVIHWNVYKSRFDFTKAHSLLSKIATPTEVHQRPTYKPGQVSRTRPEPITTQINATSTSDDIDDQDDEEYDYDDLRAEAAIHAKLRAEAFQKAAEARSCKEGQVAWHYAQQGHLHTERMKDANRRAAEMTFKIKNKGRPDNNLDLHCLHVDEALQALAEKLSSLRTGSCLFVITGRGLHSKGTAKIKPAVTNYLQRHHIKYEEINAGLLKVKK